MRGASRRLSEAHEHLRRRRAFEHAQLEVRLGGLPEDRVLGRQPTIRPATPFQHLLEQERLSWK